MKLKVIKFDDNLKIPTRSHYNDAGLDCYSPKDFNILPKGVVTIPLNFGLEIPDGMMVTIRPRSSINKKGLITQIGTIDSGYRGNIAATFVNPTEKDLNFQKGDKICQLIVEPVIIADLVEDLGNERGTNGFGSTGR